MKILLFCTFIVLALGLLVRNVAGGQQRKKTEARTAGLDIDALINAIAAVESGNDPHKIGRHGERGRCQFMRATWMDYSRAPFESWAGTATPHVAAVERAHLLFLLRELRAYGYKQLSPELVGAAWLHGPAAAPRHAFEDRSVRIGNLYRDARRSR